ncbi:CcoH [Vibrio harveyi]|uniref:FixH family protein n=1 Tax=Vibrio TaxID=662 RepID=UPI000539559B|nr:MULTISPECIES: FixH family protein [Vibrio]AIV05596.1 CcoH [Vibrio harveyi]USD56336.1 FixH family protein [Vibrio sp. SCSIO 43155]HDM8144747.1 FixH family protein [Vibrio harveyi]HDM8159719.1 FixH family protein [Vibrio harveyi]HDM8181621.1 FixH family protein [Vibrio harveyi]
MVKPWYKQFWPWFLIILPLTVVVWTIVTVVVFANNSVSLVAEDYYKKGKGINIDISKMNVARDLGLNATISSDNNTVVISFNKGELPHFPALTATFTHRTLPDRDFTKLLTADAKGNYRLTPENSIQGPWFVELEPHNKEWMIQGRVEFPAQPTTLMK